jgi:hypothetical protein
MPWCRINPDRIPHLSLFGYDMVSDEGGIIWMHGPKGRIAIEKADPWVWLDDEQDALQIGAKGILQTT